MKTEIVILNYNGAELLPRCLPSIVEAARKASPPAQVTILDNRSTDTGLDWVRKNFPEAKIFTAPENRFLSSFNDYLRQSDAEIAILLNNDIRVEADFVGPLVKIFEKHPDALLASPRAFSFDGSRYEGGRTKAGIRGGMLWSSGVFKGHEVLQHLPDYNFASGFGAFHRKRFLSLGGYDDLYLPGIIEDADLGFRAWRDGCRSYYVPESKVYHWGQASFEKAFGKKGILTLAHRNSFLFVWKNISDPWLLLQHFLFLVPRLVYALLTGRTEFVSGFSQALKKLGEVLRRRKFPLRQARNDREIFRLANNEIKPPRYLFKKRWKRFLAAIFDAFGSLVFLLTPSPLPLPLKGGEDKGEGVKAGRILVIRVDSMGDGALNLPALEVLKQRYPRARIDFLLSRPVEALYRHFFPESKIHLFEKNWRDFFRMAGKLRNENYDLGIDFRGDLRTILLMTWAGIPHRWGRSGTGGGFLLTRRLRTPYEKHELLENLELVQANGAVPRVEIPPSLISRGPRWFSQGPPEKRIVIHIGAGYPSKRWGVENYMEIARRIKKKDLGIPLFIGMQEEKRLLEPYRKEEILTFVNLAGKTSLEELVKVFQKCDLYVGNDSGPAHLAALTGLPVLLVFSGTNDFRRWTPWADRLRLINHPVPCSPCEEKVCPLKRQICLEEISVEEVFDAVETMLQN